MTGAFDAITTALLHSQNQFASGGLLLMVIGGIVAYLNNMPAKIFGFIHNQFTVSMTITDDHTAFEWVEWWFQAQEYTKRMRRADPFTPVRDGVYAINLKPSPGLHWFFHKHRPLFINFSRATEKKGYNRTREESYGLWTFGRDQNFLKTLLHDMRLAFMESELERPTLKVWKNNDSSWYTAEIYAPRPLDSVILPSGLKEKLLRDIKRFKDSRTWYADMGVPYHRGYLLYGPPGTGKTSLISGLANHFNSTVYILKLNEVTDTMLVDAISQAKDNSMIILEDVDCAVSNKTLKRKKKEDANPGTPMSSGSEGDEGRGLGLTLSGLLNALDGLQTPNGVQFFMTTNHVDKLDAALLRPGRTDVRIELGAASDWQKTQLYMRFFPLADGKEALQFVMDRPQLASMAEFQEALMQKHTEEGETCVILTESEGTNEVLGTTRACDAEG
jgi:chaperone BCS1